MVTRKEVKCMFGKQYLTKVLGLPEGMEVTGFYTDRDPAALHVIFGSEKFSREEVHGDNEFPVIPFYQLTDDKAIADTLKDRREHPEWY